MSKIPVNDLIALFRRMYDERWPYVWGAAREGCVDCSGAFVWAYRQFGQSIAHGSNAIARRYVTELLPISEARPGMAAFKYRTPGQKGYDLPAKYTDSADKNDYYHIGLVDSTGKYVLNAQGTKAGFTRTKIGSWGCVGHLKAVDYGEGDEKPMQMTVIAESGTTVKMRSRPDKSGVVVSNILIGTTVEAGENNGEWTAITDPGTGRTGYMMTRYLTPASEGAEPATDAAGYARTLTTNELETLRERVSTIESALEVIRRIVWGVG